MVRTLVSIKICPVNVSDNAEGGTALVELTLKIDETVKRVRPDSWRGVQAKEAIIKDALYGILQDVDRVESLFTILSAQREY